MGHEITPEELAELLEKLDAVCEQARELSVIIKSQMAQSARHNYPAKPNPTVDRRKKPRS